MSARAPQRTDESLVAECSRRAVALLKANLRPTGILAATPSPVARARGYAAIFGRDAAICALGMAVAPDATLQRHAATGLITLARHQARNGQIPKFVDTELDETDFWYLGCIDATLWWLIAVALLDRQQPQAQLRQRFARNVERALVWLSCQEHQRFHLLQQNEASDWADIMPRSGFVLYSNALWYAVKRLYRLPRAIETHRNFNQLFHPVDDAPPEYRRARLLVHYARRRARQRDLYFSFVNFSFHGDEGDVFGNVLAILAGLADEAATHRSIRAVRRERANEPYPVRAVCEPIREKSLFWRPYMSRHRQNFAWQYHNGGIWPFVGAFWVMALAQAGLRTEAEAELGKVAQANALGDWAFTEWLHGRTFAPQGMAGQSWNAASFLLARHLLCARERLFPEVRRRADSR
ncbi:MAG: glycoside hydrolase 100 family protein [Betaproteobacteria bacterium]